MTANVTATDVHPVTATDVRPVIEGIVCKMLSARGVSLSSFDGGEELLDEISRFFTRGAQGRDLPMTQANVMLAFDFARFLARPGKGVHHRRH